MIWLTAKVFSCNIWQVVCVLVILVWMTSALAFSASIMCSTRLRLLVCLACFPTRLHVCIYMLSTYVAGISRPPWGNQGELLRPTSKSSPVFPRFLSSPALTSSRPAKRTSLLLCLQAHFLFLLFSLSYWHLLTTPSFLCSSLCGEHAKSACSKWAWAGFYDPFWHHGVPRVQGKFWCASLLPTSA